MMYWWSTDVACTWGSYDEAAALSGWAKEKKQGIPKKAEGNIYK